MADRFTTVVLANRTQEVRVLMYDGQEISFGPGERKSFPGDVADFLLRHSLIFFDPILNERTQWLQIVTPNEPVIPLAEEDAHPLTLLDDKSMDPTMFDANGAPLRREVKNLGIPTGMLQGRVGAGCATGAALPRPEVVDRLISEGVEQMAAMPAFPG